MEVPRQDGRRAGPAIVAATLTLILALSALGWRPATTVAATSHDPAPAVTATFAPIAPPTLSAKAAYAFDATANTPLFAVAADERLPPASLTKIATALVVLDHA